MIVLPMAGRSTRFKKAGYSKPKFMLDLHGRSVFEHVTASFSQYFGKEKLLFIALESDQVVYFIRQACRRLGLSTSQYEIALLAEPTLGQAQTVAEGLALAPLTETDSLTIFNIDTIRPGFSYPKEISLNQIDGYLEVFKGGGDNWSFVKMNLARNDSMVEYVAEKERISDLCSTGLYYFRSLGLFTKAYESMKSIPVSKLQGGERYIAPLYNNLIQEGCTIKCHEISDREIIPCGLPEEYEALCALSCSPSDPVGQIRLIS